MDLQTVLVALHLIGFAFGVGGATSSDLVFLRAIKNGKISRDEFNIIKTLSTIVWASVVLLLVSGAALMAWQQYQVGEVPRFGWSFFQLKMVAFAAVVINGIVFHFLVFPQFKKAIGKSFRSAAMKVKYPLFAITGAVSIVSWYTAFFMAVFGRFFIDFSFIALLSGYMIAVAAAAAGAYVVISLYGNDKGEIVEAGKRILVKSLLLSSLFFLFVSVYVLFFN